ncbi:MAG: DUF3500 domain-containing protein [Planctomycetales bacterium]|nr:DUF3500 domain-containing protein [Planctomycetales bacterium]
MSQRQRSSSCPDCSSSVDRRQFLATSASVAVAAAALPAILPSRSAWAAPTPKSAAENSVRHLYDSLNDEQKKIIALPLDDQRRRTINANWHITEARIGQFTADQQAIIKEIVKGCTSEDGYERFLKQMQDDNKGIENYSIALFGNPHEEQFEFELTGRHLTLRADGNTLGGMAFGGPIVYGHGARGNSDKNLFVYQTKQVNKVFEMLDPKQREQALLEKAPHESSVQFEKEGRPLPGIGGKELSSDQKDQLAASLRAVMQPYRKEDVDEVMEILESGGGLDSLHLSFYRTGDLDEDQVWDIWRLESPTVVCHFRGAPHVHAYINIAKRA